MANKRLLILLIIATIGFPSSVGVTEICAVKFDQIWAKRVLAITQWNKAHPDYVKKHNLTRDMSSNTRRSKEWLRKQLEVICGVSIEPKESGDVVRGVAADSLVPALYVDGMDSGDDEQPLLRSVGDTALIAQVDSPLYDNPSTTYTSDIGPSYGGGWFGGGYIPTVFPTQPIGPGAPIAITPEPLPFGFVLIGMGFLVVRKSKGTK